MDAYLIGLARDYVDLVETMQEPGRTPEERHALDSQRQVTHRQLCQYTGLDLTVDMYRHCKNLLLEAKRRNYQ